MRRHLEIIFSEKQEKYPNLSTIILLSKTVEHQQLKKTEIESLLKECVDKADYQQSQKEELIEHLYKLSHS